MNPLVKKEIRLLLPSWIVAMLLALVQGITRPYDFYVVSLLFFGLTMMALTTIGRETSLNTFSLLLSQPAERIRIWQTKLSVQAVAFLTVFVVWLAAFGIALINSNVDATDRESSYNLFITICLIATATFTGGLWTTLLLRQIAGAFWLTLLVPAVLAGFTAAFLAENHSNNAVIAVLCVVLGIYSVGGFLFARWLFFRAQDVGWSGGVIALPEWKFFAARSENAVSPRNRKPIYALIKKEFQLHQVSLMGATGLLLLHIGVIVLRSHHKFAKDSAGEVLTAIFWMLWLVLPVVIGAMAVAEERRLGVMEGQLCLPVSRRVQFGIKALLTLFLGTFLGGVMPMLLEGLAIRFGALNPVFTPEAHTEEFGVLLFQLSIVAFSAWLALVSFFASTLARSFLQAVGYGIATFIGCMLLIPVFNSVHIFFLYHIFLYHVPGQSILPVVVTVPTLIVTLFWLAYLNFKNFRAGWPLWRRSLLGFAGAFVFIVVTTAALYNRVWEIFEPAEPAHGLARFSLSNPPIMRSDIYENLLVRLPDGRMWFDYVSRSNFDDRRSWLWMFSNPLPKSAGPQKFISGSNWVDATARHADKMVQEKKPGSREYIYVVAYCDSVGIQPDGTLWVSDKSDPKIWTADKLKRFGNETNWQQLARSYSLASVLLLKKNGTLWRLGTNYFDWHDWPQKWPGLRAFKPYQIGTNSDWSEISSEDDYLARKADGSVWRVWGNAKNGEDELIRETNHDQIPLGKFSKAFVGDLGAFIRKEGTLWLFGELHWHGPQLPEFEILKSGTETNWASVAVTWGWMVALKSDGTLWKWDWQHHSFAFDFTAPPTRLGIHNDWVAITITEGGVVSLAADGSLWFWPDRRNYEYQYRPLLLKLPKQPEFLGNVFGKAD
jgi:ABC-type transport system involved in multi-copper enzyme maturation permease subunit